MKIFIENRMWKALIICLLFLPLLQGATCKPHPESFLPAKETTLNNISKNLYMGSTPGIYEADNPLTTIRGAYKDYYAFRINVRTRGYVDFHAEWLSVNGTIIAIQRVEGPCNPPYRDPEKAFMERMSLTYTGDKDGPASYNSIIDELLESSKPVYWFTCEPNLPGEFIGEGYVDEDFTFLVPHNLVPGKLRIFTTSPNPQNPRGAPFVMDISHSSYKMAVVGDSAIWGQGHKREETLWRKLADTIGQRTGKQVEVNVLAHSGSWLSHSNMCANGDIYGEVPRAAPDITCQINTLENREGVNGKWGERVNLLLMDGCINDVDPFYIVTGLDSINNLINKTRQKCYDTMKETLRKTRRVFPNAKIIVVGYYQIISNNVASPSIFTCVVLEAALAMPAIEGVVHIAMRGMIPPGLPTLGAVAFLINAGSRSEKFRTVSDTAIKQAVDEVDEESLLQGDGRILFVPLLEFDVTHAAFTLDTWLYGYNCNPLKVNTFSLSPQDNVVVAEGRRLWCERYWERESDPVKRESGKIVCELASGYHPNLAGRDSYYRSIMGILEANNIISVSSVPPTPPPQPCVTRNDCLEGQWCLAGVCRVPPSRSCRSNHSCDPPNMCAAVRNTGTTLETLGRCDENDPNSLHPDRLPPGGECRCMAF
jgi:hypothetical protein